MTDEGFDYPLLVQQALLGVVRQVLGRTAEQGLAGEHHFYLSFRTDAPGVVVPARLRKRYPAEMTVVLQHEFFELDVDEDSFAVSLKFGGELARIEVPFAALTSFTDPSVPFGLQFGRVEPESATDAERHEAEGEPGGETRGEGGTAEVFQFPREGGRRPPPEEM